ncbi:MAG: hypothetical protein J7578_00515 [Chitinophagaceae bacterium]|nr:hypothetical protein [Chitinophagaceae bacterium]
MKYSLLLILLSACSFSSLAQKKTSSKSNKEEIEKMIKEVQKRAASGEEFSDEELDNSLKKMVPGISSKDLKELQATDMAGFPKPNPAVLAALPKKPLSAEALKGHIEQLYKELCDGIDKKQVQEALSMAAKLENNTGKLAQTAVALYYKGAPQEAVLLATKAAIQSPSHDLNLNNLAAMLVCTGAPWQAFPILRTLSAKYPNNAMVLNNMGQAFAGLGAQDSAMVYLAACIKREPNHPEANNTAAHIQHAKGNKAKAAEYIEQSLKGAFNESASDLEDKDVPSIKVGSYFRKGANMPDYFNLFGFKKPRHQMKVDEEKIVKAEHAAFLEAMEKISYKLNGLSNHFQEAGAARLEREMNEQMKDPVKMIAEGKAFKRPFSMVGMRVLIKLSRNHRLTDLAKEKDRYNNALEQEKAKYDEDLQGIMDQFEKQMSKYDCGEGRAKDCAELDRLSKERCKAIDERGNTYLQACALAADAYYESQMQFAREEFFFASRYGPMAAGNQELANAAYYQAAEGYIIRVKELVMPIYISPYCKPQDDLSRTDNSDANPTPECPIDVNFTLFAVKVKLNCEELEIEGGEGLTLNYKKNFKSKQSTLSISAGIDKAIGYEDELLGKLEMKGEIKQSLFITFGANNEVTDAGIKFTAGVTATAEASNSAPESPLKITNEGSQEVGYTLGIHSGWNFEEGPLKDILSSSPKQVNSKVGMYKK